jgi:protoporphyrinogen oxidase
MSSSPIVIIGAGISGVSAARDLKKEFLILEKEGVIGGLSSQYPSGGYWFDYGGHYFHFKDKEQIKVYLQALHPLREYRRSSKVFVLDRFIPFPIQFHLAFLPARLRQTILAEILPPKTGRAENLYAYLEGNFGPHLFRLFFEPFLHKYYGCDLRQMAAHMDKGSIPLPDKETVVAGARGKRFLGRVQPGFLLSRRGAEEIFPGLCPAGAAADIPL